MNWRGLVGLIGLILFVGVLLILGASTVTSGPRTVELDDGTTIRIGIGKTWPGSFDSCVYDQEAENPPNCYRETIAKQSIIKQPAGAASALIFSAIGLVILFTINPATHSAAPGGFDSIFRTTYGYIALFMGPGAIIFHATLTSIGGWFDQISMYLLLGAMSGFGLASRWWGFAKWKFFLYLGLFTLVFGIVAALPIGGATTIIFAATGGLVGLFELALLYIPWFKLSGAPQPLERSGLLFWISFGLLVLAILPSWYMSLPGRAPTDMPWHSLWHMTAALFVGTFYLYLDTQRPVTNSTA